MRTEPIRSKADLAERIRMYGFLPFFRNGVPGWSVAEQIDPALWFTDEEGPWEWKGPLASDRVCVYGKFLRGKAAFVDLSLFADLANSRRDGYDWEGILDENLAPHNDRLLMRYVDAHPYVLSTRAKRECGFSKGYDAVLTRLQMQTWIVTADFVYNRTAQGVPYGWGNAVIDLAERWLGEDVLAVPEGRTPEESFERVVGRVLRAIPDADQRALRKELTY